MTIHLPNDVERSIEAAVQSGRFASVDEAMTRAAHLLLSALKQEAPPVSADAESDPLLGCMRDDAELMDEIVADAYRHRREDKWREFDL